MIEEIIKGYNWIADIILQEWAVRTIGTAFFSFVCVVMIRVFLYGKKNINDKRRIDIKKYTAKYYLPLNFTWSIIFAFKYYEDEILNNSINWYDWLYWFLIYSVLSFGVHLVWEKGIAPFSDKKFNTNWLGKK